MSKQLIDLSVIIPAYNEAQNINKGVLDQVSKYLKKQPYSYEVLIVDDGSTDETVELVEKFIQKDKNFKLIHNDHGGKAITVMSGLLKSTGQVALFTDMDQATPISEIEKLIPFFEQGHDLVIGSRSGRKGAPMIRKLTAWGFSTLRTIILGLPYKDTQCGFKSFNRHAIDAIFPQLLDKWKKMKTSGAAVNAGFDVEVLFLAKKKGLKVKEVPVQWHHVGTERVQIVKDAIEAIRVLINIRITDIQGKYK